MNDSTLLLITSIFALILLIILYLRARKKNKVTVEMIDYLEHKSKGIRAQLGYIVKDISDLKKMENVSFEELESGHFCMLDEYEHPRIVKLIHREDQGVNINNHHIVGWAVRYENGTEAVVDKERITGLQRRWHEHYNKKKVKEETAKSTDWRDILKYVQTDKDLFERSGLLKYGKDELTDMPPYTSGFIEKSKNSEHDNKVCLVHALQFIDRTMSGLRADSNTKEIMNLQHAVNFIKSVSYMRINKEMPTIQDHKSILPYGWEQIVVPEGVKIEGKNEELEDKLNYSFKYEKPNVLPLEIDKDKLFPHEKDVVNTIKSFDMDLKIHPFVGKIVRYIPKKDINEAEWREEREVIPAIIIHAEERPIPRLMRIKMLSQKIYKDDRFESNTLLDTPERQDKKLAEWEIPEKEIVVNLKVFVDGSHGVTLKENVKYSPATENKEGTWHYKEETQSNA